MDWKFYIILLTVFSQSINAQKEDHNWILNWYPIDYLPIDSGHGASIIDFNFLPPKIYGNPDILLDFDKSNAIISDEEGNVLLYSNAMSIHDRKHQPIINGEVINYGPKWEWLAWPFLTSSISSGYRIPDFVGIVPLPDSSIDYLLLYQNYEKRDSTGFYELWSSSIRRLPDGSFSIVDKDVVINETILSSGALRACKHANGRDWWLLQFNNDIVYAYLITPNGLSLNHTQQIPFELRKKGGQSKFNEQGDMFAYYGITQRKSEEGTEFFIADFDRCSGILLDPKIEISDSFLNSDLDNAIAFSPNGRFVYIANLEHVFQYDLEEEDFFSSKIEVLSWDEDFCNIELSDDPNKFGLMQLAPNNIIYLSNFARCNSFNIINKPNEKGLACDAKKDVITLPTNVFGNTPTFNTYRLGPLDGSPCDTLGIDNHPVSRFWYEQDSTDHHTVQLWDVSYFRPESWEWNFGDGSGSEERHPIHEYDSNGNYEVCLTVSNENSTHTSCQDIQIGPVSTDDPSREYDISIYPNPVEDFTRLVFHDYLPEEARIVLYDISGRKVFSTKVYQESMIDLSGLGEGAYFYEVMDVDVSLVSGKLVKM